MKRMAGRTVRTSVVGEDVRAFVPDPLPPRKPALSLDRLATSVIRAEQALMRLEIAGAMVPSLDWFIYAFVRKEAVVSSQIEGTQATLMDLLAFEATDQDSSNEDVEEICNYVLALNYARTQLTTRRGLPMSVRLLNETHRRLMRGTRGKDKQPGELRRTQNWIGVTRPSNAVYVPPPPERLDDLLGELERYIHGDDPTPKLVRIGLIHAQFESIHPYMDGNGRLGRLLIALLMEHWQLLAQPLLYLSLFFKRNRGEYYSRLNNIRTEGDWEGWLDFFLEGVATIADEAVSSARELFAQVSSDRAHLLDGQSVSVSAVRLFEHLPRHPIVSVASATVFIQTSKPTAIRAIEALVDANILVEQTGRKRDRTFAYQAYLQRLRVGTELALTQ